MNNEYYSAKTATIATMKLARKQPQMGTTTLTKILKTNYGVKEDHDHVDVDNDNVNKNNENNQKSQIQYGNTSKKTKRMRALPISTNEIPSQL